MHRDAVQAIAADLRRRNATVRTRYDGQLGGDCSRSPRWARGVGGALLGGVAGGVLGVLAGFVVGLRKLSDASAETAPIKASIGTAIGVTVVGAAVGGVVAALPSEC